MTKRFATYFLLMAVLLGTVSLALGQEVTDSIPEPVERTFALDSIPAKIDSFYLMRSLSLAKAVNPELYKQVYRWYKTKYRSGGGTEKGIDCSGFVNMIYASIYNKKIPRSASTIFPVCQALPKKEEPQEGDLVFFNIRGKKLSHVGIYLQDGKFAHASVHSGVVISSLDEAYYKKYFYKFGRVE